MTAIFTNIWYFLDSYTQGTFCDVIDQTKNVTQSNRLQ